MLERLLNLLGKSVDSPEIIALYEEFGAKYPKKITGNSNYSMLKGVKKDGLELHFGIENNGKYLNPKPTKTAGTFIAVFVMIQILETYKGDLPHEIKYHMNADELTKILGKPKEVNFMGKSFIWKKNISDKHEIKIDDSRGMDEKEAFTRTIMLQYIWEDE